MQEPNCRVCANLLVCQWNGELADDWRQTHLINFHIEDPSDISSILPAWSKVCIMYVVDLHSQKIADESSVANSFAIEKCHQCRESFADALSMPKFWWSKYFRNGNGGFGCESTRRSGVVTGFSEYTDSN